MNETNSVVTALLAELIANHVTIGTIDEILTSLAAVPLTDTMSFDSALSLEIAAGVTQTLMFMEHKRAQAQKDEPKILDASGQEA